MVIEKHVTDEFVNGMMDGIQKGSWRDLDKFVDNSPTPMHDILIKKDDGDTKTVQEIINGALDGLHHLHDGNDIFHFVKSMLKLLKTIPREIFTPSHVEKMRLLLKDDSIETVVRDSIGPSFKEIIDPPTTS